eukprot:512725-Pleurochrysis_carterae.AAC.1
MGSRVARIQTTEGHACVCVRSQKIVLRLCQDARAAMLPRGTYEAHSLAQRNGQRIVKLLNDGLLSIYRILSART